MNAESNMRNYEGLTLKAEILKIHLNQTNADRSRCEPLLLCMIRGATFGVRGQTSSFGNFYGLSGIKMFTCGFFC